MNDDAENTAGKDDADFELEAPESEVLDGPQRCGVCGAMTDPEDLFCHNCGTEVEHGEGAQESPRGTAATHTFRCQSCGASMRYDASAQALRCPFCGATELDAVQTHRVLEARRVVPMRLDQAAAGGRLRQFLGSSFWHPGDLGQQSKLQLATAVYVPYWVFSADAETFYTADSSRTPPGARADWYPVSGQRRQRHEGVLVSGSSVLTPAETNALLPFDLRAAVPTEQVDLENITVEEFRVARRHARPQARAMIEQIEQTQCAGLVPGRARNVRVNVMLSGLASEAILLPVWILAYRYRDQVYRVLVNGQSGQVAGQAPTSYWKLAGVVIAVAIAAVVILICAGVAGGG
ncbi:zinc ribbon domain-containing protein [Roseimaritima sediminicola]|uniref:zinc ribbon domain-containing protein n=1 Tax=Roseimaritima sediminicola TaxID=2662066 RepID=UPI001298447C|nr:zinc ribbon domain-containing protein [Roseimaritima sediminicola]